MDFDPGRLVDELRKLTHDHLLLATLETRLAVNSLLRMAVIAMFSALVLVGSWLALVGSATLGLIHMGLDPALAMLWLAAVNLALAITGWRWIRRTSHWLGWPATLRAIRPAPVAEQKRAVE